MTLKNIIPSPLASKHDVEQAIEAAVIAERKRLAASIESHEFPGVYYGYGPSDFERRLQTITEFIRSGSASLKDE